MATVLLVEDEFLISMMLEDTLNELGHQIVGRATCGKEALAALRAAPPDLAVVDLHLADGLCDDLIAQLTLRRIPFVVVTGTCIDRKDRRFDGIDVLTKPLDLDAFHAVLDALTPEEP